MPPDEQDVYPQELAESIWDMLILSPSDPGDVSLGMRFISRGCQNVGSMEAIFEWKTSSALLMQRITALDCKDLSISAFKCFLRFFTSVSLIVEFVI